MEKFDFASTRRLQPRSDAYFTKDTAADGDTASLTHTNVIWTMSQNVDSIKNHEVIVRKEKLNYPLLLSILAYMTIQNPIGTLQTLAKYAEEKLQHIRDILPSERNYTIAPNYPAPTVLFMHTIKTTTPDNSPS